MPRTYKTPDEQLQQLALHDPEELAALLLEAAAVHPDVQDRLDRLLATAEECTTRARTKLAALRADHQPVFRRDAARFARELEALLDDIDHAAAGDARTGLKLVAEFVEHDAAILEQCDDSNGSVGDVFRVDVSEQFARHASRCDDKAWVRELLLGLITDDDYGVRACLMDHAAEFLPPGELSQLGAALRARADAAGDRFEQRRALSLLAEVARQTGDPALFERATLEGAPDPVPVAWCIDIAREWWRAGESETALSWLQRIPEDDGFRSTERDHLLLTVLQSLGRNEDAAAVAWRIFRRHRTPGTLDALLEVIGADERARVVADEVRAITEQSTLSLSNAAFLIDVDHPEAAATYLLSRNDQLDGDFYSSLLRLADAFESRRQLVVTSAIYRALLDSILRRANSRYYHHGVRYLRKLDALAPQVTDWTPLPDHTAYVDALRETHGRKRSFWTRYRQAGGDGPPAR